MEFKLRTSASFAELIINTGDTKTTSDVSIYSSTRGFIIPDETIEQFITTANEMSRFNQVDDVDFVKKIYDAFLNGSEKKIFLELINKQP